MEKFKTWLLTVLVVLSLLQSYLLAYSMPGLGATLSTTQDYVNTVLMGSEENVENLIFPEDLVLHMGEGKHTVLYPAMNFYDRIYERIRGREFKGFQRSSISAVNWDEVRERDQGVELRFGRGVPVELLSKVIKLEGDLLFLSDVIDRIWIFKEHDSNEVRTYFFSADSSTVYESVRADLTAQDIGTYVGFGEYQTLYKPVEDEIYIPLGPVQSVEALVGYKSYSAEQMQSNLFFDPAVTRAISNRSGSQIYTDGKRGLQVDQNGKWISYTDPVARQEVEDTISENVYASIAFINQHGGWDGMHRFIYPGPIDGTQTQMIRYQQYYGNFPIIPKEPFLFGDMRLRLQQGAVSEYERSLLTLQMNAENKSVRWLPGGEMLEKALAGYIRRGETTALYPALLAAPQGEDLIQFEPVWVVRLTDGTQEVLMPALKGNKKPLPGEPGGGPIVNPDKETAAGTKAMGVTAAGMNGLAADNRAFP